MTGGPFKSAKQLDFFPLVLFLCYSIPVTYIPYLLYGTLLVVVGISRVFVLAHFPHQVVTGSIAGISAFYCVR